MSNALIITSVASMVEQFLMPSICLLQDMGYDVEVACNFEKGSSCNLESIKLLKKELSEKNVKIHQIDFERNVFNIFQNLRAYKQLTAVVKSYHFDLIHCHSPIGGMLGRLSAVKSRKNGSKVFYTAHGFHFHKGAPLLNWLIYYPIEKFCSLFTDTIITINHEDYSLAKRKMKAKHVEYVPGVGVDLTRFENIEVDRAAKRREIGVPEDAFLLMSVGELNENKNHQVIIKAMAKLGNKNVHYAIAGKGDKKDFLINLADSLGVGEQLHLLGYRRDIPQLNASADAFCFPSLREGLGLGAIEGMACGLPLISSNVHGINDYSEDGVTGYKCSPFDVDGFADAIANLIENTEVKNAMSESNKQRVKCYSIDEILPLMKALYES